MESDIEVKNVAYGVACDQGRETLYAMPSFLDAKPLLNKGKTISKPIKTRKTATAAGIALVLAIFALFAAIVAIYFAIGFQGTDSESANEDSSQEHLQQISNLQQMIQTLKDELNSLQSQLNNKSADQDAAIAALTNTLARNLGTFWNPVRSCSDVPPGSSSSNYWVQTSGTNNPVQVYCDMNRTSCSCNTTGVWMRVANLDMTDSNQNCPPRFRLVNRTSAPLRVCGRPSWTSRMCVYHLPNLWGGVLPCVWSSHWLPGRNTRCFWSGWKFC